MSKRNIVENNNNFTDFSQVWSKYIFTDDIPDTPLSLEKASSVVTKDNVDKSTQYTLYIFDKTEHEKTYNYLIYVSNLQLVKEFRQGKSWKLILGDSGEEVIRNVILPSLKASREYTPKFSNGEFEIPFTSVDPDFDLSNCRLNTGLNFDKLYFTGWLYVGQNLQKLLIEKLPPFDDTEWLLKNIKTGNRAKIKVTKEATYTLPDDDFDVTEDSNTILTTNVLNQALAKFGELDEGEYW